MCVCVCVGWSGHVSVKATYGSDGMRLPTIITSIVIINELPPKTTRNQLNIYPMPTFKQQAATERDI